MKRKLLVRKPFSLSDAYSRYTSLLGHEFCGVCNLCSSLLGGWRYEFLVLDLFEGNVKDVFPWYYVNVEYPKLLVVHNFDNHQIDLLKLVEEAPFDILLYSEGVIESTLLSRVHLEVRNNIPLDLGVSVSKEASDLMLLFQKSDVKGIWGTSFSEGLLDDLQVLFNQVVKDLKKVRDMFSYIRSVSLSEKDTLFLLGMFYNEFN